MLKRKWMGMVALLLMTAAASAQQPTSKPAAVVNGEVITQAEVLNLMKIQPTPPTPPTAALKREMEQFACNMLIDDVLMRQYLNKNAPPADQAEVQKEYNELVKELAKDKKTVQDALRESGRTEAQLRQDIVARVQWKAFIMPRLPDTVLKQYYDANKVFFDKVFVKASHILVKVPEKATQAERQAAYNRILAIKQELAGTKIDFAQAAQKYSECPTKANGGDLGPFPYKFVVVDPFAKAAFAMNVGQVSDVVTTEFGYHLIKVTDRTPGEASNFEKSKDDVRELYSQEIYQHILQEQRKNSRIETSPQ